MAKKCKHCKQRIVQVNYAGTGMTWMHQVEGASFEDQIHRYCHLTPAEPEEE